MMFSLPYILLIIFLGICSLLSYSGKTDDNTRKDITYICIAVIIFFYGFRGFIHDDWINYYPAFQRCSWDNININLFNIQRGWNFEPGFTFLMCLCKGVIDSYNFFVFVCICINTALLVYFFRNRTKYLPFAFALYLVFGGHIMNANLMRNSISLLVFINALGYLRERRALPYFLMCLLALSFHISSVIFFPLYFFFHKKCNKWLYIILFIIGNLIFLLHIPVFMSIISIIIGGAGERLTYMIEAYSEGKMSELTTTISIGYLERLITGTLILCYYDRLVEIREENRVFINAFIGYFIMFFYLSEFQVISQRMSTLFIFAYWILWYDLPKCFSIGNNRRLFLAFLSVYCVLKVIGTTNFPTAEYDNILLGAKSYEERLFIHQKYEN